MGLEGSHGGARDYLSAIHYSRAVHTPGRSGLALRRRGLQVLRWLSEAQRALRRPSSVHKTCAFRALQPELPRCALDPSPQPADRALAVVQRGLGRPQEAMRVLRQGVLQGSDWGALPTAPKACKLPAGPYLIVYFVKF